MSRRRLGVLLATLAVLSAACQRQSSLQPPRPAAVVSCEQVLAADAVYHHYRVAVRALAKGQEPAGIPGLRCFLGEDAVQRLQPPQAYRQLVGNTFDADILYAALRKRFDKTLAQDRRLGLKRDAGLAWPGAYLSEAALVAYRKTGQQRFLDLFVHYFDAVLQRRDDRLGRFDSEHKRVMPAWGSVNIGKTRWIAHVTHNARIVYPATEFARLVLQDASLQQPALLQYRAKAEEYIAASRETLDAFEDDLVAVPGQAGLRWYRRPLETNFEATNHLHVVGTAWLNLALLTGEPRYKRHVEELITVFLKGVRREPDGLVSWNYFPFFAESERRVYPNGQEYSEPVWKAVLTVPFLVRAAEHGYRVPAWFMTAIGRTFSRQVLQGDQLWRNLARKQSRVVDLKRDRKKRGMLKNTMALSELGDLEPELAPRLAALVASRPDLFPLGWLSSPPGLLGYAYYLKISSPRASVMPARSPVISSSRP
jgi:hypothetical protein